MQAVILTAGRGDRLKPATDYVPKPLIPFWGRPFVAYVLDTLVGVADEVVVVVSEDGSVRRALGESWHGIPLRYVVQPCPGGTGDAVLHARHLLDERFLLVLGDTLAPRETLQALIAEPGDAVLALIEVDDPENHLGVAIHNGLVVEGLWAKGSRLVHAGLTVMPSSICEHLQRCTPQRGELRVLQGVEGLLNEGLSIRAIKMDGPWLQYGDHEGVAGVCRVMNQIRPYADATSEHPLPEMSRIPPQRAADGLAAACSVDIRTSDCEIVNSLVFGPGELIGCTITDSLVYCARRVEGASISDEIIAWV